MGTYLLLGLLFVPWLAAARPAPVVASQTQEYVLFTKTLRLGSRGEEVHTLQTFLRELPDLYRRKRITGRFDAYTQRAIKVFQKKYGLRQSGRTDAATRASLNQVALRLANPVDTTSKDPLSPLAKAARASPPPPIPVSLIPKAPPPSIPSEGEPSFRYSWRATEDLFGEVHMPTPAPRPVVLLNGKKATTIPTNAAVRLAQLYSIVLVDDGEPWDEDSAAMILDTLERLPKTPFTDYGPTKRQSWKVILSEQLFTNDILVSLPGRAYVSKAAFARSNPTLQPAVANNAPRVFYSNRLFQAVLKIFYSDLGLMLEVIREGYGFKAGFGELPESIPQEERDEYQEFTTEELQYVASVLEDLPSGFRNIPGLTNIIRRRNGLTNPFYPNAAAIAWIDRGYMEFMDKAFIDGNDLFAREVIAHEITHFLWANVLREETRQQFMKLSGWSKTPGEGAAIAALMAAPDHPKSTFTGGPEQLWYRTTTTNFISAYAAAHNPDEDFAETMAAYIYQPELVATLAPDKYTFIKDIVDGYEYVILVDERFTFQVFNLEPDLTFPGKIIGVDIEVYKEASGDNRVIASLHLSPVFGGGAEQAYARIVSRIQTYTDQYFFPVDGNKFLLRAEFTINMFEPGGYWLPEKITVSDQVDNRRYEGQAQFGWLLFIDNPKEDLDGPIADIEEIHGELTEGIEEEKGGHTVTITIPIVDERPIGLGGNGSLVQYESGQNEGRYIEYPEETQKLTLSYPIRDYRARGAWVFREFWVFDKAKNERRYDLKERALSFFIPTKNPDTVLPTLDTESIRIKAVPRRPEAPDGETDVIIWYKASDDNSGLGTVAYTLLKPNGQTLYDYHSHENTYTPYFLGNPQEMKEYKIELTLPPGSIPGTWILRDMTMYDKAGNILRANFTETGILKPFKVQ